MAKTKTLTQQESIANIKEVDSIETEIEQKKKDFFKVKEVHINEIKELEKESKKLKNEIVKGRVIEEPEEEVIAETSGGHGLDER